MDDRAGFLEAAAAIAAASDAPHALSSPFVAAFPVERAALSVLGDPFGVETMCASDHEAFRLDELQIDLGEGPSWQAIAGHSPVIEPDIANQARWPSLSQDLSDAGVRAVFAFPLSIGLLDVGAVNLYAYEAGTLSTQEIGEVSSLATLAAAKLLRRAMTRLPDRADVELEPATYSRREVHQATGMVSAQLGVGVTDALLIIRAHAYAAGRPVREVSADVVARRLVLSADR